MPVLSTYDTGVASPPLTADGQPANSGGSINGQSGIGVILQLTQAQASQLLLAINDGTVWFVLRPEGKKAADQPVVVNTLCTLAGSGLTAAQLRHAVPFCVGGGK